MEGARDRDPSNTAVCCFEDASLRTCISAWILALFASTRSQATIFMVERDQML